MTDTREGGCQCGAVRYCIQGEPAALVVCHCSECQRQSGSAFGMSLIVPRQAFALLSGELASFGRSADSGRTVDCRFCRDCGTRIYHAPSHMNETLNIKPGTLDDTSWLIPAAHVWARSKQPWVVIPDGVRCLDGQP